MKRALSAAAMMAMVALLVPLMATARKNEANPNLTIEATPGVQVWPRQVTISGTLKGPDNASKTVELGENPFPLSGGFKPVGTTTTDDKGDYSFQVVPQEHTNYRTRVTDVQPAEISGAVTVRSRMKVTRRVSDRTPPDGGTITFSGRVGPAHEGMDVLIQRRRRNGSWRTMTTAPLGAEQSDGTSLYSTELEINRDGVWRAKVLSDADHLGNKSHRVRIDAI